MVGTARATTRLSGWEEGLGARAAVAPIWSKQLRALDGRQVGPGETESTCIH